jgi:hypothetical protein
MWLAEMWEQGWQVLGLWQLSETGFGRPAIAVNTVVLLANTFSPLAMLYITTEKHQRNRRKMATAVRRLLLFDASCDLM